MDVLLAVVQFDVSVPGIGYPFRRTVTSVAGCFDGTDFPVDCLVPSVRINNTGTGFACHDDLVDILECLDTGIGCIVVIVAAIGDDVRGTRHCPQIDFECLGKRIVSARVFVGDGSSLLCGHVNFAGPADGLRWNLVL